MQLLQVVWNVDPEIFSFGPVSIRYYGLLWALSFVFGYLIFDWFVKRESLPKGFLDSLTTYTFIGTVLGARLGHCLFYQPEYYLRHPLEILKIWEGGLASHGAALGIILALYLFSRKHKRSMLYVLDRIVIPVALAGVLIRLGNLMNSEIYGMQTSLPWGFVFVRDGQVVPKHPTQLYEALSYLVFFVWLLYIYIRNNSKPRPGLLFGLFLALIFGARLLIEFVKEPQVGFEESMALNMGQLLSIPFIIIGLGFVFWAYRKQRGSQKAG